MQFTVYTTWHTTYCRTDVIFAIVLHKRIQNVLLAYCQHT